MSHVGWVEKKWRTKNRQYHKQSSLYLGVACEGQSTQQGLNSEGEEKVTTALSDYY